MRFRASKTDFNHTAKFFFFFFFFFFFSAGRSKAVPLLHFFFVYVTVVLYAVFLLSLFVFHISICRCPGRLIYMIVDISWVASLALLD